MAESSDHRRLDRALVGGIAWTSAAGGAAQIVRWAAALFVARLLTPEEYGLVGMATVFTGFIQMVSNFGLDTVIVQKQKSLSDDQIARLGGVAILAGVATTLGSVVCATPVAAFFAEPEVRSVVVVLGLSFTIQAFAVLPRSLLRRDLRFRQFAILEATVGVVMAISTLLLAIMGYGYWSLVFGHIIGSLVGTALANTLCRHRIAWPCHFASIKDAVTFGYRISATRIAWYLYGNADFAIVGRLLGKASLGDYTIGWTLANIPIERVTSIMSQVTPGVLAASQHQPQRLRRYICGITEGISLLTFPACVGIALVADDLVLVGLGDQWANAVMPLRILSVATALRSLGPILSQTLVAVGRPDIPLRYGLCASVVLPLLFLLGSRWGIAGVASGWLIGFPVLVLALIFPSVRSITGLTMSQLLGAVWPALSSTLVMVIVAMTLRIAVPVDLDRLTRLALVVPVSAAVYAAFVWAFHRKRIVRFAHLFRSLRA